MALERHQTETKDQGCPSGDQDKQSDLCAQWKAADAAQGSMWAAIVGLVAGFATLFFAWRAAHWAREAAAHTKSGSEAAQAASRPWLSIKIKTPAISVDYAETGYILNVKIGATNSGVSPANFVRVESIGMFFDEVASGGESDMMLSRDRILAKRISDLQKKLRDRPVDGPTVSPSNKYYLYEEARFPWDWSEHYPGDLGWLIIGLRYSFPGGVGEIVNVFSIRSFGLCGDFEGMGNGVMAYAEINPIIRAWPRFGYSL